jgi:uncharacterized protein (TIGR02001 family)
MKKHLSTVLGATALSLVSMTATPASAQIEGLSANAAVTTNYVFRGISQSGANPAVQAGLDYAFGDTGLAIGTWASSIDFGNTGAGSDAAPVEWDLYGSYTLAITDAFSLVGGGIAYIYPSTATGAQFNWFEIYGGLSYNFGVASVSGRVYYSPDYVNLSTSQIYFTGGVSVPVTDWLALNGNIGYTTLDHAVFPVIEDYLDWNLSAVATLGNFSLTVGYTDTDLEDAYEITSGPFQTTGQFYGMIGFRLPAP